LLKYDSECMSKLIIKRFSVGWEYCPKNLWLADDILFPEPQKIIIAAASSKNNLFFQTFLAIFSKLVALKNI